jgi:hypothetical protein
VRKKYQLRAVYALSMGRRFAPSVITLKLANGLAEDVIV